MVPLNDPTALSSSATCGPNWSRAAAIRLAEAASRSCRAFLTPSTPTWVASRATMAFAAVWNSAAAEQSSAEYAAGVVVTTVGAGGGGGGVELWLAHPARTRHPSVAATTRARTLVRQPQSEIPTVLSTLPPSTQVGGSSTSATAPRTLSASTTAWASPLKGEGTVRSTAGGSRRTAWGRLREPHSAARVKPAAHGLPARGAVDWAGQIPRRT